MTLPVPGPAANREDPPRPPVARRIEHVETRHGENIVDPYYWLREKSNPEVAEYLRAEDAHTTAITKELEPFRKILYEEMLGRIKQTDLSVPVRQGRFYYYSRTEEGKQYPIYCRKAAAPDGSFDANAPEILLLDQNEMAKGLPFLSITGVVVSDDGNFLAYGTDTTGFRQYALQVKDLSSGRILPDTAERVTSMEWAADNRTLFYTTEDSITKRSCQLWRLALSGRPELIFEEKDELYSITTERTKDLKYLLLEIRSTDTWETRCLDAGSALRRAESRPPPGEGAQIRPGAPGRSLLSPDQQGGQEFPGRHRAGYGSPPRELEGARASSGRHPHRGGGPVPGALRRAKRSSWV